MRAQMLEASLLGVGTVLRLERDGCVVNMMVKLLRQATNDYAPPHPRHFSLGCGAC